MSVPGLGVEVNSPRERNTPTRMSSIQAHVRSLLGGGGTQPNTPVIPSGESRKSVESALSLDEIRNRFDAAESEHGSTPRISGHRSSFSALSDAENGSLFADQGLAGNAETDDRRPLTMEFVTRALATSDDPQRRSRPRRKRRHRRQAWERQHRDVQPWPAFTCFPEPLDKPCRTIFISGMCLTTFLAAYLAGALTDEEGNLTQAYHVTFIIIILVCTIAFCHGLVRLCMFAIKRPSRRLPPSAPKPTITDGYTPTQPIRVHLAQDEELGICNADEECPVSIVSDTGKNLAKPPPAYGKWRSSVRADPNLLHWQRVDQTAACAESPADDKPSSDLKDERCPRPPSYVSDDGVEYVVEAAPRSTVAMQNYLLNYHTEGVLGTHPAYR